MVQNIHAHKGEGCLLPECFEDFSRTNSANSHVFRESEGNEKKVCTRRLPHLFLFDDGVIVGENTMFVKCFVMKHDQN